MNAPAAIGHNNPPSTPYEALKAHIDDLEAEARNFLDGEPIASEEQATAVSKLLDDARKAKAAAEEQRKIEAKPFDDGKAEVQARWTPFTKDKTGKCDLIAETAKKVLTPWLNKLADEQRAAAEAERQEAERLAAAAREALEKAGTSLSARIDAEALVKAAGAAGRAATRAEKAKAHVGGGERARTLRPVWNAALTSPSQALQHYKATQPEALKEWLLEQAMKDVRSGKRAIPGFEITESKVAV